MNPKGLQGSLPLPVQGPVIRAVRGIEDPGRNHGLSARLAHGTGDAADRKTAIFAGLVWAGIYPLEVWNWLEP